MRGVIERVARAAGGWEVVECAAMNGVFNVVQRGLTIEALVGSYYVALGRMEELRARAVMKAMKYCDGSDEDRLIAISNANQIDAVTLACCYDAMIDAALQETPQ